MITVDDKPFDWKEGMTVAMLLSEIVIAPDCAVIRMNGKTISRPKFENTVIPDQADIILVPMIAGG